MQPAIPENPSPELVEQLVPPEKKQKISASLASNHVQVRYRAHVTHAAHVNTSLMPTFAKLCWFFAEIVLCLIEVRPIITCGVRVCYASFLLLISHSQLKPLVKHVISKELQMYYEKVTGAVTRNFIRHLDFKALLLLR